MITVVLTYTISQEYINVVGIVEKQGNFSEIVGKFEKCVDIKYILIF